MGGRAPNTLSGRGWFLEVRIILHPHDLDLHAACYQSESHALRVPSNPLLGGR